MERVRLGLHSVGRAVAAGSGDITRRLDHDRPVGQEPPGRGQVHLEHLGHAEPARHTLVGERGVDVAVGDHGGAPVERRTDHLRHELGARRGVEEGLCPWRDLGVRVEQERPDPLAGGRASGLAHRHDLMAGGAGRVGEERGLGRLPAAVQALEGDEHAVMLPTAATTGSDPNVAPWTIGARYRFAPHRGRR